jgi:capsule assembly protein Wzi
MWFSRAVSSSRFALVLAFAVATRVALAATPPPASPLLPPDHWAVDATRRLHDVGLLPEWMPAQRAVPLLAIARALAEADERATRDGSPYAAAVRAWRARFAAEWRGADGGSTAVRPERSAEPEPTPVRPERSAEPEPAPVRPERSAEPEPTSVRPERSAKRGVEGRLLGASASLGLTSITSRNAAPPSAAPATLRLPDPRTDPLGGVAAAATLGDHLAAGFDVEATPSRLTAPSLELVGALGPVQLSVGRGRIGYGPNEFGAVVASGTAPIDRVEFMTTVPFRLPWLLAYLGDFTLDTAVARFSEPRHPYTPLLWEFDLQWRPHPRLTLGAVRGVMFGGAIWEGIPTSQVPLALLGIKNYKENNVYSGTIDYRLPTEALLPLTAKIEWGTDDEPAAAWKWPGLVVGLAAPMLGSLPVSCDVEYAYFGRGVGPAHAPFGWYTHGQYVGGWATQQTPLGDALGGNGRALRVGVAVDPLGPRLLVRAVAFVQDRSSDNLYAPASAARSVGGDGEVDVRFARGALGLRAAFERGEEGWRREADPVLLSPSASDQRADRARCTPRATHRRASTSGHER